jgi:hypothetical protein
MIHFNDPNQQEITLTLTCTEALELRDVLEWLNDPEFKPLAQSIDRKVYERRCEENPDQSVERKE